jgi:hypothetical protein
MVPSVVGFQPYQPGDVVCDRGPLGEGVDTIQNAGDGENRFEYVKGPLSAIVEEQ